MRVIARVVRGGTFWGWAQAKAASIDNATEKRSVILVEWCVV
jgi:hypothetical protein